MSLSIPCCYTRLKQTDAHNLFHLSDVVIFRQPAVPADHPSQPSDQCQRESQESLAAFLALLNASEWVVEELAYPEEGQTVRVTPESLRFSQEEKELVPLVQHTQEETPLGQSCELFTVDFKGAQYLRILRHTQSAVGVEAAWTVSDFTRSGEEVFSLRMDLLKPRVALPRWALRCH